MEVVGRLFELNALEIQGLQSSHSQTFAHMMGQGFKGGVQTLHPTRCELVFNVISQYEICCHG
jgi:hypothetical protein